jgi:hypothetical protein
MMRGRKELLNDLFRVAECAATLERKLMEMGFAKTCEVVRDVGKIIRIAGVTPDEWDEELEALVSGRVTAEEVLKGNRVEWVARGNRLIAMGTKGGQVQRKG